jgi:hypothetical protein
LCFLIEKNIILSFIVRDFFQADSWEDKTPKSSIKVLSKTLENPVEENETLL